MQERICVINNKTPMVVLPNRVMPTVPIINKGPELLVKASILSASSWVTIPCYIKLLTILAPTG